VGTHARDKDAIVATLLIAEMATKYKSEGTSIHEKLTELYEKYGYYKDGIQAITKIGRSGAEEISNIMTRLRNYTQNEIADNKVIVIKDYEL